jgi:hypothetical protein
LEGLRWPCGVDQGIDLSAVRHGGQVAAPGGRHGADSGTLINSLLQAATGKQGGEIAGSEAVAGTDSVDRSDGKLP